MNTLLPCPFCGSTDVAKFTERDLYSFVECGNCHTQGPFCVAEPQVIKAWNQRTPLSSPGWRSPVKAPCPGVMVLAWGLNRDGLREFYVAEWTGSTWMARGPHWNTIVNVLGWAEFALPEDTLSSPGPGGAHLPGKPHSLNDHAKSALVVSSPEAMNKGTKSAKTGGEETLSPRTMHKGSPGGLSAGDTFRCYNCDQPVARIHAKPDEGYCARCDKVVTERPPLMPGRPDTFLCPNGHTAKRIMWSANGWCDECGDIVEEGE